MYLDVLFLVDAAMNTLLLISCARLTGAPIRLKRILLGAATGGLSTVALWFLAAASPALPFLRAAVALLVTAVAFDFCDLRLTITRACVLYAVTCALAGVITSIGGTERLLRGLSFGAVFFAGLAVCLLASIIAQFRELHATTLTSELTLTYHTRTVTLRTLFDTGHSLVDPISNRPVLVATLDSLRPLLSPALTAILDRIGIDDAPELLCALDHAGIHGFTLIPYRTVGNPGGLLPAFLPDSAMKNDKPLSIIVAITSTELSPADTYDALLGVV